MEATSEQLRARAADSERAKAESFERCDTDGFLSQWAHDLSARRDRVQADILDRGGVARFPGLVDGEGRRIRARIVRRHNQWSHTDEEVWLIEGPGGEAAEWVNRTSAEVGSIPSSRRSKMAKMGLHEEWEDAPAQARYFGSANVGVAVARTDGGYPPEAVVFESEEAAS